MPEKTAEILEKIETRTAGLRAIRTTGLAEGLPEDLIVRAERSLLGAFALADAIDAIRRAAIST